MTILLAEQFYDLKLLNNKYLDNNISFPQLNWIYLFPKELKKPTTKIKVTPKTINSRLSVYISF